LPQLQFWEFWESGRSRTFSDNCFADAPSFANATRAVFYGDAPDYKAVNVFVMAGAAVLADGAAERRAGAVGEVVCARDKVKA